MASNNNRRYRVTRHPILPVEKRGETGFTFNGRPVTARRDEVISSALFANGIRIFGHHPRDGGAQGIYCVNGQCGQCMVLADGKPVKACMTPVREGMRVESCEGVPGLELVEDKPSFGEVKEISTGVLIIGGGPAGINAATELGNLGIDTLLVDDKSELGGKLTLQTHTFFGSRADCYAGTRGFNIAKILEDQVGRLDSVSIMLDTTAVGAFCDSRVGLYNHNGYTLVKPEIVLVACGAREKTLAFPGCDLPGVYGAGAFQTLLNRDLIYPTDRLFIVGGGNVGLIAGYHAIQAGIKVVGLVEALPQCGGYKVHLDKLRRLGVPVYTSHTVIKAEGGEMLEGITMAEIDENFKPVEGTERAFRVDTLLIAVGLSPVNELYEKLTEFGVECYTAGDADEIAEASAAIFSGRIVGRRIARKLGVDVDIPEEWEHTAEVLRSKPGEVVEPEQPDEEGRVYPLFKCAQEIPCNPCTEVCPRQSIHIDGDPVLGMPYFEGECIGCGKCVDICPGLAVNLLIPGYDREAETSLLIMPYELNRDDLVVDRRVGTVDMEGNEVGEGVIKAFRRSPTDEKRTLVSVEVPAGEAKLVSGFTVLGSEWGEEGSGLSDTLEDETIVCRCERVTAGEVRAEIRKGVRDMNVLKATIRTGMGACGGKTCTDLILRLYREEGVDLSEVTLPTSRPFVEEVPLSVFAGMKDNCDEDK